MVISHGSYFEIFFSFDILGDISLPHTDVSPEFFTVYPPYVSSTWRRNSGQQLTSLSLSTARLQATTWRSKGAEASGLLKRLHRNPKGHVGERGHALHL